jgi:hypothetical protein
MLFAASMMKYLLLISTIVVAFSCEKKMSIDRRLTGEKRKIKMIMESVHDPIMKAGTLKVSPKLSKDSLLYESYFNKSGILVKRSAFNLKANLQSSVLFKYDKDNNNIECIAYNSNGSVASKRINKFDAENKLIEGYEFDGRGKVIHKTTRNDSAGYKTFTSYKWISRGLVKTLESVFDKNGNNVANYYFSERTLESREIRRYDINKNVLEIIQHYPITNEQIVTRFKYDEQNNKVESIVLRNNLVTSKTMFNYDIRNNLTETLNYEVQGTLKGHHKYFYEFDDEGNWTKRINTFNDRPTVVSIRQIKYY